MYFVQKDLSIGWIQIIPVCRILVQGLCGCLVGVVVSLLVKIKEAGIMFGWGFSKPGIASLIALGLLPLLKALILRLYLSECCLQSG